jgi:hypothetical protein
LKGDPELEAPSRPRSLRAVADEQSALANEQIEGHRRQKTRYETLLSRYSMRADLSHQLAPLRIGVAYEDAYIAFWKSVAENPDAPTSRSDGEPA